MVLDVHDLSAGYGGVPVVNGVGLHVRRGETACVVGPNGCGKSTLLKSLAGVLPIMGGRIELSRMGDISKFSAPERVKAGVGYVPQTRDVFPPLTVEENLDLGGYLLPSRKAAQRKDEVLDLFPRLRSMLRRHAGLLSGGERKMLAMARVLILEPDVLLLDEPTAGLTEEMASRLLDTQLASLKQAGVAVLLVEQRANLALKSADYAYVLSLGRVQREGNSAQLHSDPEFAHIFLGGVLEDSTEGHA